MFLGVALCGSDIHEILTISNYMANQPEMEIDARFLKKGK
jgi:hypothetical protein